VATPPATEPSEMSATSTPASVAVSTARTPGPKKDSNLAARVWERQQAQQTGVLPSAM
jgi:hypothetical protein